jgi:hypothetical protein
MLHISVNMIKTVNKQVDYFDQAELINMNNTSNTAVEIKSMEKFKTKMKLPMNKT